MKMNWNDPEMVSLYERLAATIQHQLEQDLTGEGRVANLEHFGHRAAATIFERALHVDVYGSSGEWTISVESDPVPSDCFPAGVGL